MSKKILVVTAHADDETLGCGGTLLKHRANGDAVSWIISTAPSEPKYDSSFISQWNKQIDSVAQAFGMEKVYRIGLPVTKLDTLPESDIINSIGEAIAHAKPDIVYIVHPGDSHADHRIVYSAAIVGLKPFVYGHAIDIYCFETISSTNVAMPLPGPVFEPQHYCDISSYMDAKLDILKHYKTEIKEPPHPRSAEAVRALARFRGSSIFVDYAEAFSVIRTVK